MADIKRLKEVFLNFPLDRLTSTSKMYFISTGLAVKLGIPREVPQIPLQELFESCIANSIPIQEWPCFIANSFSLFKLNMI